MEIITLLLFCAVLTVCILLDVSILYALVVGYCIFAAFAKLRKYTWREIGAMTASGIGGAGNILLIFLLIGVLTALWRAAGTVPVIITYAARLIRPETFFLMTFVLNCGISLLTGTAFGTAATMGVICMTMAAVMGQSPVLAGGAVLAGAYFGDRCAPVSTSALLICSLTKTDIFINIKKMISSAAVPFFVACAVFAVCGFGAGKTSAVPDLHSLFGREFSLHWIGVLPATVIILLSLFRCNVKITMLTSIAAAFCIAVFMEKAAPVTLLFQAVAGFSAGDTEVGAMLNGGGVVSMVRAAAIVCSSSAYAGIFRETGLLKTLQTRIYTLGNRTTVYCATFFTAAVASLVACNQTLSIMLTHQLCEAVEPDAQKMAMNLENTAVVLAPLVPWSIANTVPLASAGAPAESTLAAVFLYVLPLWCLLVSLYKKKHVCSVKE